jgi:hypothetical protein
VAAHRGWLARQLVPMGGRSSRIRSSISRLYVAADGGWPQRLLLQRQGTQLPEALCWQRAGRHTHAGSGQQAPGVQAAAVELSGSSCQAFRQQLWSFQAAAGELSRSSRGCDAIDGFQRPAQRTALRRHMVGSGVAAEAVIS